VDRKSAQLTKGRKPLNPSLRSSLDSFSLPIFAALQEKDRYTGGHAKRVAHYAGRIALALDRPELSGAEALARLKASAMLHDAGKIEVDDRILKKPAPLDELERHSMRRHPELGLGILASFDGVLEDFDDVVGGMRFHHERWDGTGYPLGLRGEGIPLFARIIAVADAYDALVSTRPYRRGIAPRLAREEILKGRETQFDPCVVDAFALAFTLP
jgi:HD-GYP domain-containing protein (c-di-GMP phosphodiesterase class II)